jgi:hypothetical protein
VLLLLELYDRIRRSRLYISKVVGREVVELWRRGIILRVGKGERKESETERKGKWTERCGRSLQGPSTMCSQFVIAYKAEKEGKR